DGRTLASGDEAGEVLLWGLGPGKLDSRLEGHDDWVRAVAYSRDGKQLASAGWDSEVRIYRPGRKRAQMHLGAFAGGAWSVAFMPDGLGLAAGAGNGAVSLYRSLARVQREVSPGVLSPLSLQGHRGPVSCLAFTPDGKLLASGSHDRTVRLW